MRVAAEKQKGRKGGWVKNPFHLKKSCMQNQRNPDSENGVLLLQVIK